MVKQRILNRYDSIIIIVTMLGLLLAVSFQVLYRFVPNLKFSWSLEFITYLFSWLTWMGIGVGIQRNSHVGIDILVHRLSARNLFILRILHSAGFFIFLATLLYFGTKALQLYLEKPLNTPAMKMPYYIYRLPIVVGSLSGIFRLSQKTRDLYRDYKSEGTRLAGWGER